MAPPLRRSILVLALACLAADLRSQPPPEPPAGLRPFWRIYNEMCASCHGNRWAGGRAPTMLDDVWSGGSDDEGLAKSIREGSPVNGMPAFGALLHPQEVKALVYSIREAHLRAKQNPQPAEPPEAIHGRVVASEKHTFKVEVVAEGFRTPWALAFLPDGNLLVTERPGRLQIVSPGKGIIQTIGGLPPIWVKQDGGLLDVALDPDYAQSGWVYLAFTERGGTGTDASSTRVIRGKIRDGSLVDQQTLFQAPPELYWQSNVHFGARFFFDRDGMLYFGIGDRGRYKHAQELASPYGKLHRMHPDGRVPADNPFADAGGKPAAWRTVWTFGHRNQQGIAQHPVTGDLWASEHGPRGGDELNVIRRGQNYGWPIVTNGVSDDGTVTESTAKEGMESPVAHWSPSIAPGAAEFYVADKFPQWRNNLFLACLTGKQLRRIEIDGRKVVHQEPLLQGIARVRDVATGPDGLVYVILNAAFEDSAGHIIRLVPVEK